MQQTQSGTHTQASVQRSFAKHWQRYDQMMEPFELRLIDAAGLRTGDRVIDVGCGAGTTSLDAGRCVGIGGDVLGIDLDGQALGVAVQRAQLAAASQVHFMQANAANIQLELGRADAIVSRFGNLHFGDPVAAHAHLRGALRPGGSLHFICARDARFNPWATVPTAALMQLAGQPMTLPTGGPFTLANPATIHAILGGAGFESPRLRSVDCDLFLGVDIDDALEFFFEAEGEGPQRLLERLGVGRAMDALRASLRPFAHRDGVWMPGSAWLVSARRPT